MAATTDAGLQPAEEIDANLSTTSEPPSESREAPQNNNDSTDQSSASAGAAVEIPLASASPEEFVKFMADREAAAKEAASSPPSQEKPQEEQTTAHPKEEENPPKAEEKEEGIDLDRLPERQRIANELSRVAVAIQGKAQDGGENITLAEAERRASQAFPHLAPKEEAEAKEEPPPSLPEGVPHSVDAIDERLSAILGEDGEFDTAFDNGDFTATAVLKGEIDQLRLARDQVADVEARQSQEESERWEAERDRTLNEVVKLYPDAGKEDSAIYQRGNEILLAVESAVVPDPRFQDAYGEFLPTAAATALTMAAAEANLAPGQKLEMPTKPAPPKPTMPNPPASPGLTPSSGAGGMQSPQATLIQEINTHRTPDQWVEWMERRKRQ